MNQQKIIDFLQNELKLALYKVNDKNQIVIESSIPNLRVLMDFVTPLNHYLMFSSRCIYIMPNN